MGTNLRTVEKVAGPEQCHHYWRMVLVAKVRLKSTCAKHLLVVEG